ncbi:hypothetical protein M8C21_011006 [Ambrosia artemisiifolia]|uniref:Uncharacterized protein n=1 Tax=Ambrosia artemisiifolia TaxID=4212 RepID=A0AAD5G4M7_AMBAR|nr:hypothetical protein M8C21_011006 [Ambrosia artemisiifolia]
MTPLKGMQMLPLPPLFKLNVCKCNECGQPLPESFELPVVQPWTTGRIWASHDITRFDCMRLRGAFAQIDWPPPEPKWLIDSLALLTQRLGRRAGDLKMVMLANYFRLGKQSHRQEFVLYLLNRIDVLLSLSYSWF